MYCRHCGGEMPEDAIYCPRCGAPYRNIRFDIYSLVGFTLAVALLLTDRFIVGMLALVFSLYGIRHARETHTRGGEFATAGTIISSIFITIKVVVAICTAIVAFISFLFSPRAVTPLDRNNDSNDRYESDGNYVSVEDFISDIVASYEVK